MKVAKRFLSVLLCLLLGMAVMVPAVAQEGGSTAPIITRQPKNRIYVTVGQPFTLNVEAKLPEGVEGTLIYKCSFLIEGGGMDETEDGGIICWDGLVTTTIEQPNGKFTLALTTDSQTICIQVYNGDTGEFVTSRPVEVVVFDSFIESIGLGWDAARYRTNFFEIFAPIYMPIVSIFYHIASLFNSL